MKCSKCGDLLDSNGKCLKCSREEIELIGFSGPEIKEEVKITKKKKIKIKPIIITSLLILLTLSNIILIYNLPIKTEEVVLNEKYHKRIIYDKQVFAVPSSWQYDSSSNELLLFYNDIQTFGMSVEFIPNTNYEKFLENLETVTSGLNEQGFQYSSTSEKKINNKNNYLIKGLYDGYITYIIISEKDSENLMISKLMFTSAVDKNVLDEALNIINNVKDYNGFSFDNPSFTFKALKKVVEKVAQID